MTESDNIVFHFENTGLYKKFIQELSAEQFVKLLKKDQYLLNSLFSGCRINSRNFSVPMVQRRVKDKCKTSQKVRDYLCDAWIASKKQIIYMFFDFFPHPYDKEASELELAEELKNLKEKLGLEKTAEEIVKNLIWTETDPDDIRILISILSLEHEDQKAFEQHIDKLIENNREDPSSLLEELEIKIEENKQTLLELEEKKGKLKEERIGYQIKLNDYRSAHSRDLKEHETQKSLLEDNEKKAQDKFNELKKKLAEFQTDLGNIQSNKNLLQQKYKKSQKKAEDEEKKISEEIDLIDEATEDVDKAITTIMTSVKDKSAIKEKLGKEIVSQKRKLREQTIEKKGLKTEHPVRTDNIVSPSIPKVKEELTRATILIGQLEPLRRNEKGFVATPSTLDIFECISAEKFEPPIDPPKQPENISDIDGYVSYWAYQSVWGSEKWDEAAIVQYSLWRSMQIQNEDAKLAAELALSGVYHAERTSNIDHEKLLLLRFFEVIAGINSIYHEQNDFDNTISELLEKILDNWERKTLFIAFISQLSLISPPILEFIFDIANKRGRVLLKRVLSRSFKGLLDFNEHDPSHEVTHIITSTLEQKEAQIRSASNRWLIQDSIDTISQNARGNLMASLAAFPDIGPWATSLITDEFESQVSAPLTRALRSGVPQSFEHLSLQCYSYSNEIIKRKSWICSVYLWPCVRHLSDLSTEANIQAKRLFRASLNVSTDKPFYPLNIPNHPCPIEVVIKNNGNTEAIDLKVLIIPSLETEYAEIDSAEINFRSLKPDSEVRQKINVRLKNDTQFCVLEYMLNWKDSSSMDERSQTGTLKLLSQREVDWNQVQNPYSLKSIKDPARLKGRSDVMSILRRSLDSMDSYYITGQRRTGKSSVAQVYYKELNSKSKHAAIYLWWGHLATTELAPICYAICDEFSRKLKERTKKDDVFCPLLTEFSGNENYVFRSFFRGLHERFPKWKFFMIIDDFDELPPSFHETEEGDRFFLLLRALLDQEFIALYLIGSEKLPQILKRQGERLNLNQRCEIDYLKDPNEIEKIIVEPAIGTLEFDTEGVEKIKLLSAGNPYYATLICSRLFNDMARKKDYFISKRDVEKSTESIIEEDALSTYQHFWKDGVFLPGQRGDRQQYHNAKILIAMSRAQAAEDGPVSEEELIGRDDLNPLSTEDVKYALNSLLDRKVVIEEDGKFSVRVPLFSQWLSGSGARAVEYSFAEAGLDEVPIHITRGLSNREIIYIAQDLVYQDKDINEILIADWLAQFGSVSSQRLAFKLLKRLREEGYYNQATMFSAFKELHKQIVSIEASESDFAPRAERRSIVNIVLSYLDPHGKSGHACQYNYRRVNRIHSKCAISPDKLVDFLVENKEKPPIIFADDILGTGGTISKGFKNLASEMDSRGIDITDYKLYLASVVGTKMGIEAVESATEGAIRIMLWHEIDDRLHAFSERADIFSEEDERKAAKEMVEEIGKELEPKHPLGRNKGELLVAFQHGCPNNTLPIFYKSGRTFRGREWRPLFPR